MTRSAPSGAPGSIAAIRDRPVREVVGRTRDALRTTREMLDHSREFLERVRQRTAAAAPAATGEHTPDPAFGAGAVGRTGDGRA